MSFEDRRLQALTSYGVLDTAPDPVFDAVTRAAQLGLEAPIALISLVDEYRQWFKSVIGLDVQETPRSWSFCTHALNSFEPMIVEDASTDPRFADNPLVTGDPHIRLYAGAPLIDREGYALGTLCVIDRTPRQVSRREIQLLGSLADCAMNAIVMHQQGALLRRAERVIQAQMERQRRAG